MESHQHRPSPSYTSALIATFGNIYHQHNDLMKNMSIKLPMANPNRNLILNSEYPIEKKSKTLGTVELRRVRFEAGKLLQIGGSQEKELPMPNNIRRESYQERTGSWNQKYEKQYPFRICMQFCSRNPINIYLQTQQQQYQVAAYLHKKYRPQTYKTLCSANKQFKKKLLSRCLQKILKLKMSQNYNTQPQKKKYQIINKIKQKLSDVNCKKELFYCWQKFAVMKIIGEYQVGGKMGMSVKEAVPELGFGIDGVKIGKHLKVVEGVVKLWVGQVTFEKTIRIERIHLQPDHVGVRVKDEEKTDKQLQSHGLTQIFCPPDSEIKIRNLSPPLSVWTVFQLQMETVSQDGTRKCWRSDRFYVFDFLKSLRQGPKKTIALWSSKQCVQVQLHSTACKTQLLPITHPPQHHQLPNSYTHSLHPSSYPILQQFIPNHISTKYIQSINPQNLHLQYSIIYHEYLLSQAIQGLSYNVIHRLYGILDVDGIVDKFYGVMPYKGFGGECRGSYVYEVLVGKAEKFCFYDAEKYVWKYPENISMRRLLSVLKTFDEMPRINFSEPFLWLCLQCLKMSEKQSMIKRQNNVFENSVIGRESLAFFVILGLLKCSSQILFHQNDKKVLSSTSMLFHFVLKKHFNNLYHKILNLQLNIQALFGSLSVGLFAELFNLEVGTQNYGSSHQVYLFILSSFLIERKQSPTQSPIRQIHYISLISIFLSLLELLKNKTERSQAESSALFSSPSNFIMCLKIFTCTQVEAYLVELMILYKKYYVLCEGVLASQEYQQLHNNMRNFYAQQNPNEINQIGEGAVNVNQIGLGELMQQLYAEFSSFKHKNQGDIRKICIIINHIELGDSVLMPISMSSSATNYKPPCLQIELRQQGLKLYEHQYVMNNTRRNFPIQHKIEQKLNKLTPLTLTIIYIYGNTTQSYFTTIDPISIPSNVYIQQVRQIFDSNSRKSQSCSTFDVYAWRYVALQLFIKDSCDVDVLENVVPTGYVNGLLLNGMATDNCPHDYRTDIIFTNHYFRSFRLTQNNFNLLYAKLGWYGNHYLIPTSRLLSLWLFDSQKSSPSRSQPVEPHNTTALQQFLIANKPECRISQLSESDRRRMFSVLFYSRCVYGRGILPSVGLVGCQRVLAVEGVRNGVVVQESKLLRNQINQCSFNSCGNLAAYLFDNFQYSKQHCFENGCTGNFIDFYIRAVEQLPLLRYLTFRPLQFYLLQQIILNLKIISKIPQKQSTRSQYFSLRQVPDPSDHDHPYQSQVTKQYKIILTNHPIGDQQPYKFISDSSLFPTKVYLDFNGEHSLHNMKILYMKLDQGIQIPQRMYFTLPVGLGYWGNGDLEIFGINASVPLDFDSFLYMLQINIMYYYVLKMHDPASAIPKQKQKQKSKSKQKQRQKQKPKQKDKKQPTQIMGCYFQSYKSSIPNLPISTIFPIIYQTKQPLSIHVMPINRNEYPVGQQPLILQTLYRHYTSFALLGGIWKKVCILCKIVTPSFLFFYVQESGSRIYRLMKSDDVIVGFQAKRLSDRIQVLKFTDHEVLTTKDCVKKQLNRFI